MPRKVLLALALSLATLAAGPAVAQAVEIDAAADRVDEGQTALFTVRESPVVFDINVTVTVSEDEGATPGVDVGEPEPKTFTLAGGTLGERTQQVSVPVIADGVDEPDESFTVTVTADDGTTDTASVTINDRDMTIDVAGATVGEGGAATVTLTPREAALHEVRVDYASVPGLAGQEDFAAAAGSVVWGPGDGAPKTFQVQTAQDTTDEEDESLGVLFGSSGASGASLAAPAVAVTITDDDAPVLVGAVPARVDEGDTGSKPLNLLIALAQPSGKPVRVTYRTRNGTASSPDDYSGASGTVTFNPGETAKPVAVTIKGDRSDEPDETFELAVESAENATILSSAREAAVTIVDDDGASTGLNPGPGSPGGSGGSGDDSGPRVRLSRLRLAGTRVALSIRCPAAERTCRSTVSLFNVPSRRSRVPQLRRERRLARATFTVRGGQTRSVRLRLSAANRRLLRRAGRVRVRAFAVTTDGAGNVGNTTRTATLRF
jgi:Calx-beta domain